MANEAQIIDNPTSTPGAVSTGYQQQNLILTSLYNGIDRVVVTPGTNEVTVEISGPVDVNGILYSITSPTVLSVPDEGTFYIYLASTGNFLTPTGTINPGIKDPAKDAYYLVGGERVLDTVVVRDSSDQVRTYNRGDNIVVNDATTMQNPITKSQLIPLAASYWTKKRIVGGGSGKTYTSVVSGNGVWVAVDNVGAANWVLRSTDGVNWSTVTTGAVVDLIAVTWGNGLFVAVSKFANSVNSVMTSPDGITWTVQTAFNKIWYDITFGDGLFVAVASSPGTAFNVMTSPNGINWTIQSTPANSTWRYVAHGNGGFVASGGNNVATIMNSPDGFNWTGRTSPLESPHDITYGNGVWVCVGESFASVPQMSISGDNGDTWVLRTIEDLNWTYTRVTFGGGVFLAIISGGSGPFLATSLDGNEWRQDPTHLAAYNINYSDGLFVMVGNSSVGTSLKI